VPFGHRRDSLPIRFRAFPAIQDNFEVIMPFLETKEAHGLLE
jgi:hypothetical protein